MDVAANVLLRDQAGKGMILGGVEFPQIFAKLRGDVVELELGIDFGFGFAGDGFSIIEAGQAVLAKRVSHLESTLAKRDIVVLGAGEVLHSCAERVGGEEANVNLHSAAHAEADFVVAAGNDLHQAGKFDDV